MKTTDLGPVTVDQLGHVGSASIGVAILIYRLYRWLWPDGFLGDRFRR